MKNAMTRTLAACAWALVLAAGCEGGDAGGTGSVAQKGNFRDGDTREDGAAGEVRAGGGDTPDAQSGQPPEEPLFWQPPEGAQCAVPEGDGACCRDGNSCDMVSQGDCKATGGTWLSGETCPTDRCRSNVLGACCLPDCSCDALSATDFGFGNPFHECASIGGYYLGAGTNCDSAPCRGLLVSP